MSRLEYWNWVKDIPPGLCPFCHPDKYPQIVLKKARGWKWIVAKAPYWKYHTMIIPNKHYEDILEIPPNELKEFLNLYEYAKDKLLSSNLKYDDGVPIYQYSFMWRIRSDAMQELTNIYKPMHLHLHLAPDREHLLDPVMDKNACDFDYSVLKD